jgi:cob(I)alamin adenosyltransferase
VSIISLPAVNSEDPSAAELADIEQEWPLIAAELDLLDAQIACINAGPAASALDRRRVRRAERRVLAARRQLETDEEPSDIDGDEVA